LREEVAPEQTEETPAEKEQQTKESIPDVIPHDVFCKEIHGLAKKAGIKDVDAFLKEQFKVEKLDNVTTDQQSNVMSLFCYQVENKGK